MVSKKEKEYENKVLEWRAKRYKTLTRENSWLALAGLFWLTEGRNLMGSNPMCEVILPERAPTFIGVAELNNRTVRFTTAEGVQIKVNGRSAQKAILRSSEAAKPSFVTWNDDLRLVLLEHAGRFAIRVWDNQRAARFSLPPLKWFPINHDFKFAAKYTRYPNKRSTPHEDTFGELVDEGIDGYITFTYEGIRYQLDVSETSQQTLFIKFRDETNKKETYPATRYCYTDLVARNGRVTLDFNFAYSPPCAFTEYATCLFAPPQNKLPFRVEAGEIYRGEGQE